MPKALASLSATSVHVPTKAPRAAPRARKGAQATEPNSRMANHGVPTAELKPLHFRMPAEFIERFEDAARAAGRLKKNAFLIQLLDEYESRQASTARKGK